MKGFSWGRGGEEELVQTPFAPLALLKCISCGPLQCSEAHVVGKQLCVSRELHLKRELLITLGIVKPPLSGSHLTKYCPRNALPIRMSSVFLLLEGFFLRLPSVFFVTYCCWALLSSHTNFKSHSIMTAS